MASKGTFVAYQPLRPQEIKVGDLVNQSINYWIKKGEEEKAAIMKRIKERNDRVYELSSKIKVDPLQTVAPLQDSYNDFVNQAISLNAHAQSIASDYSIPYEERIKAVRDAQNFSNQVKMLGTFMTSKEDIEAYQKNMGKINSGDYFEGDERVGMMVSLTSGAVDLVRDKDGDIAVRYARSMDSNFDDPVKEVKLSEFKNLFTTPVQDNLLDGKNGLIQRLLGAGKDMVIETVRNTDGNITTKTIQFDRNRAVNYIKSSLGYETSDDFNINSVAKDYNQLFYRNSKDKNYINTPEDLEAAIQYAVDIMEAGAKKVDSKVTKYTPLDIAIKNATLTNQRLGAQEGGGR